MTIDELIEYLEKNTGDYIFVNNKIDKAMRIALAYLKAYKRGFELCCKKEITMYNFKYLPVTTELDEIIEGLE